MWRKDSTCALLINCKFVYPIWKPDGSFSKNKINCKRTIVKSTFRRLVPWEAKRHKQALMTNIIYVLMALFLNLPYFSYEHRTRHWSFLIWGDGHLYCFGHCGKVIRSSWLGRPLPFHNHRMACDSICSQSRSGKSLFLQIMCLMTLSVFLLIVTCT